MHTKSKNSIRVVVFVCVVQLAAKSRSLGLDLEFMFDSRSREVEGVDVNEIEVSKLLRACGGCLGTERR